MTTWNFLKQAGRRLFEIKQTSTYNLQLACVQPPTSLQINKQVGGCLRTNELPWHACWEQMKSHFSQQRQDFTILPCNYPKTAKTLPMRPYQVKMVSNLRHRGGSWFHLQFYRGGQTGQTKLTFRLDFQGNLFRVSFEIRAIVFSIIRCQWLQLMCAWRLEW